MADIELVIKIPEELYKNKKGYLTTMDAHMICDAVANGTPLPKGHGKLVDKEEMRSELAWNYNKGFVSWGDNEVVGEMIDKLKTIVEEDKEE